MTRQTTGWQSRAIHNRHDDRINRAKQAAKLRRERVDGSDFTPAELLARMRDLRADFYARQTMKETP